MANDIGSVTSVRGTSVNLNTPPGYGAEKPSASAGKSDPGGHKPPRPALAAVPMPK